MHDLGGASSQYIIHKNDSAAYYFWNAGYDVWMGNARGNIFSRKHTKLDPNDVTFWKFSWHEIGYYDLPAMIDYALKIAKQTKLILIGHSQGATAAMVMLSTRPEYNQYIDSLHAVSPPVIMKYQGDKYPNTELTLITKEIQLIEVKYFFQ
jgi:pimeloyl-ACP methyl ester carboxylesterase